MRQPVFFAAGPRRLAPALVLLTALPAAAAGAAVMPFINEFHYDNAGGDVGEGIEIAGAAGTDLSNWTLHLYNGNDGRLYRSLPLDGVVADEVDGAGAVFFAVSGLQNGPDGIALTTSQGTVLEFLSYEGSFVAADGPAAGLTSVELAVFEAPDTPAGQSLQRVGRGNRGTDFTWAGPVAASPGRINTNQELLATVPLPGTLPLLMGAAATLFASGGPGGRRQSLRGQGT